MKNVNILAYAKKWARKRDKQKSIDLNRLKREILKIGLKEYRKLENHNLSFSRPYKIWAAMKARCNDKQNHNYGKRGITFDPTWNSFLAFWEDMKKGYSDVLTLDRIDNNGNYCKENCRWATYKEQANNRRNNLIIFFKGKKTTLSECAMDLGISKHALYLRYKKHGNVESLFDKIK